MHTEISVKAKGKQVQGQTVSQTVQLDHFLQKAA